MEQAPKLFDVMACPLEGIIWTRFHNPPDNQRNWILVTTEDFIMAAACRARRRSRLSSGSSDG